MTKKVFLKIITFILIVVLMIGYLSIVFSFPNDQHRQRFNSYYALPKNTVDGIYIGSSGVDRYWIPSLAWKENGATIYALSSNQQPLIFAKYLMEETMKRHDIKTFIVDIRAVAQKPENISTADIRRVTDNLRPSMTDIHATQDILKFIGEGETDLDVNDFSYYWSMMKYHGTWKKLDLEDWINIFPKHSMLGFHGETAKQYHINPQAKTVVTDEEAAINPRVEKVLIDLLDYCDTIDAKVIFVSSPQSVSIEEQKPLNYAFNLIRERGYTTLDFNKEDMYQELNWDFNHDLYSDNHANIYGAIKYTRWLTNYLQDNYKLADRRKEKNQNLYKDWDAAYEKVMSKVKKHDPDYYKQIYIK